MCRNYQPAGHFWGGRDSSSESIENEGGAIAVVGVLCCFAVVPLCPSVFLAPLVLLLLL